MGLTEDQKAMLRLLAQREEGYDDMAALMGISVEEVRERVKEALAEVDEPDDEAVPPEPAPAPAQPAQTSPAQGRSSTPRLKLPKDRGARIGLAAGALAIVALAVVLIVSGGEEGSSSSPTTGETALAQNPRATAEGEDLTQAILEPIAGGEGRGRALFGRYRKNVLLQVEAEGLAPSTRGQSYTIWLYRTPKLALQIGSVPVGASGKIGAQFKVPVQILAYVANGAFNQVDVSLTPTAAYRAALAKAKSEQKLPPHVGTSILRGEITGPAVR